ncbi:MAG: hypothetical protein VYE40_09035 [Myxococcota bacterium]|nr:hypothetical protein [Myxococcota bacterium]
MDGAFRELRSLLNKERLTQKQYTSIAGMANHVHRRSPTIYADQWIPYMASFSRHWDLHIFGPFNLREADEHHELLPFSLFAVHLDEATWDAAVARPASWWGRLGGLRLLRGSLGRQLLEHAPDCPFLGHLGYASFSLDEGQARRLAAWIQTTALTSLELERCTLKGESFESLCASGALDVLSKLVIFCCNGFREEALVALAQVPFENLRELKLSHLSFSGWPEILGQGVFGETLETLSVLHTHIDEQVANRVATSSSWPNLKALSFGQSTLSIEAARALADAPRLHADVRAYYSALSKEHPETLLSQDRGQPE